MADEATPQHHRYSASGSEGWLNCPGKQAMEKGIPDKSSQYADEGSAAHYLASLCLEKVRTHLLITTWAWFVGKKGDRDGQCLFGEPLPEGAVERSTFKIDKAMVDHVTRYVNFVRDRVKDGTLFIEKKVEFGRAIGLEGAFGTGDCFILSADGKHLDVIDLKYGYSPVEVENNSQLCLYALGALNGFVEEAKKAEVPELTLEDLM